MQTKKLNDFQLSKLAFRILLEKNKMRHYIISLIAIFNFCLVLSQESQELKCLTYNVLADKVEVEKRIPVLFKMFQESDADVIALQEVAPWFVELLLKEKWIKNYHLPMEKDQVVVARGLLILSKGPITKITADFLPSKQQRAYLIVDTKIKGIDFKIGTCHLDSPLEAGEMRAQQLDIFFNLLNPAENAIMLGDFNFGDGEKPETEKIPATFLDIWQETNKGKPGFTWDIEKSEMAKKGSFPKEGSRRIDRILFKSKLLKSKGSKIIGDEPLDTKKELFPSDHFGLTGNFKIVSK